MISSSISDNSASPAQFSVIGGRLMHGGREFFVKQSGAIITNDVVLKKIADLMNEQLDLQQLSPPTSTVSTPSYPRDNVKITIQKDGKITCSKENVLKTTSQNFEGGQEIHKIVTQQADFVTQIEKKLEKFSPEQKQEAIRRILDELPFKTEGVGEWHEQTLANLLQTSGNEALRGALMQIKGATKETTDPSSKGKKKKIKGVDKCQKNIRLFVMDNLVRPPKETEIKGVTYSQQFATKKEGEVSFTRHKAHPSELDKTEPPVGNTNLGAIHAVGEAAPTKCIITRSGKSDSSERLEELVTFSAIEHSRVANDPCLIQKEDGTYEYTHHITSYLDTSKLKSLMVGVGETLDRASDKGKNTGDERELLKRILEAVDQWPAEGKKIIVTENGREKTIILKKPIVSNEIVNSLARGIYINDWRITDMGYTSRDRIELFNGLRLLQELKDKPVPFPVILQDLDNFKYVDLLDASSKASKQLDDPKVKKALAQYLVEHGKETRTSGGNPKLRALYIVIFRQPFPLNAYMSFDLTKDYSEIDADKEIHPADLEIWRNYLDEEMRIGSSKQCKSGTDRTAIGVALAVAQSRYKELKGPDPAHFLPSPDQEGTADELLFKALFHQAIREFSLSITAETKGYSGLRLMEGVDIFGGKGNPIPFRYLFTKEDIGSTAFKGIWIKVFGKSVPVPTEHFVTTSRAEIQGGRKSHFNGAFTETYKYGIVSKSNPSKGAERAESKSAWTQFSPDEKKAGQQAAYDTLKEILSPSFERQYPEVRNLFDSNESFNLKPHISLLGFTKENRDGKRASIATQIERLDNNLCAAALLKQILWLEEQNFKSQNYKKFAETPVHYASSEISPSSIPESPESEGTITLESQE